jgi:hypothetical protein
MIPALKECTYNSGPLFIMRRNENELEMNIYNYSEYK